MIWTHIRGVFQPDCILTFATMPPEAGCTKVGVSLRSIMNSTVLYGLHWPAAFLVRALK